MSFSNIFLIIGILGLFTKCNSPKLEINLNDKKLEQFLIDNDGRFAIADTNKLHRNAWWDTTRLDKYHLTIYIYHGDRTDGLQYRFLIEDSLDEVFVLKKSGWFDPTTDHYPKSKAFERICDSIPIFEPLEYDYQELEDYFNKSIFFKTHPLDFELLDTIVKLGLDFKKGGYAITDSLRIFQQFQLLKGEKNEILKLELQKIIRLYLKKRFARMYMMDNILPYQILYIDFDPYNTGDVQITYPDGSKNEKLNRAKPLRKNRLFRYTNMRFIRFDLRLDPEK